MRLGITSAHSTYVIFRLEPKAGQMCRSCIVKCVRRSLTQASHPQLISFNDQAHLEQVVGDESRWLLIRQHV